MHLYNILVWAFQELRLLYDDEDDEDDKDEHINDNNIDDGYEDDSDNYSYDDDDDDESRMLHAWKCQYHLHQWLRFVWFSLMRQKS